MYKQTFNCPVLDVSFYCVAHVILSAVQIQVKRNYEKGNNAKGQKRNHRIKCNETKRMGSIFHHTVKS